MKKVKMAEMLIKFIKSKYFWRLVLLIFLIGILWSGFSIKTSFLQCDKEQIKYKQVK